MPATGQQVFMEGKLRPLFVTNAGLPYYVNDQGTVVHLANTPSQTPAAEFLDTVASAGNQVLAQVANMTGALDTSLNAAIASLNQKFGPPTVPAQPVQTEPLIMGIPQTQFLMYVGGAMILLYVLKNR